MTVAPAGKRRRWPWAVAAGIVALLAIPAVLLLPPVQRRIIHRMFPAGPGRSLQFEDLHISLRGAGVRRLRLDWRGLKVSFEEAEARYSLLGILLSRTARVDHVGVRGLVVDARSIEPAEPEALEDAGVPFRFGGLRPLARLPARVTLSDVRMDAELLAATPNGGIARLRVILSGRGIAPGSTGELTADVGLCLERDGAARDVLAGTGSLRVHESEEGILDRLDFHGEVRPADPDAVSGARLAAEASTDLTAPEEAYRLAFSTTDGTTKEVVSVTATRRESDGRLAGAWSARLDAGQTGPYLGDFAPPDFALNGTGTFELDPVQMTVATVSRFEVSASRWERLHPELAAIGPLRFEADVAADYAPPRIAVRSLLARVAPAGAPPVIEIGADQPFGVVVEARAIEPSRWGEPLAHLKLEGVPITWWSGSGTGLGPFAGAVRGSVELTLDDPTRVRLRSTAPVEATGVRLHTKVGRDLGPISGRADVDAEMTPESFTAAVAGCRVAFADTSTLEFDGQITMPRDGRLAAALEGKVAARPAALSRIVPQIGTVGAHGRFGLDLAAGTLSLLDAAVVLRDGGGSSLAEGDVTTVRPLVVDLDRLAPRWTEFEPESLRLRVDGFPVAWVSRYLPQIRVGSGTLHGEFHATVPPNRSVRIAGDVPFEIRDADLHWGDLQVLAGARLQVSPAIVLTREAVEVELNPIAFRDTPGNRFDGVVRVRSAPARGAAAAFTADLRAFAPSLTDRIGNLGDFHVRAEGTFDGAANALRIDAASFDCKDPAGRSYLQGASLQPFTVGLAPFQVTPAGQSRDLFRATFLPLAIEGVFPEALGFRLAGPLPSGEALISATDGGLIFHAPRKLEFGPVTVNRNDHPFLDQVHFTVVPEVAYTTTGIRSRETRLEISSAGRPIAGIVTRGVFDITGAEPARTVELTMEAALPALFDQPVVRDLPRFDRGALEVSWRVVFGSARQAEFRFALSDVARRDGVVAPDFEARAAVEEEADGVFRIEAPVRLMTPERTSDLTGRGRLRVGEGGNQLDLSVESDRIAVEDVARLATVFLPPGAGTGASAQSPPAGAGDPGTPSLLARFGPGEGRPLWDILHGRVPVRLGSVEFDQYAVTDVRATVESSSARLSVKDIGASFLGARLEGSAAVTFESSAAPHYSVDARLEVPDVNLGRIFTEVNPSRSPTIEGRFRIDAGIRGSGPDPVVALLESRGEIRAEGSDGVFRGLVPGAKSASRLVRAAGALTFSKELRATGRLIGDLQELRVGEARVRLNRDPSRGLVLESFDLRSDKLVVHATGSIRRERDKPFVERDLRLDVNLGASGDAAIVLDGLGLLGKTPDERGFRPVTETISVGGRVGSPDASDLWEALDEAAAHAKGSFGWALRKAMGMAAPEKAK